MTALQRLLAPERLPGETPWEYQLRRQRTNARLKTWINGARPVGDTVPTLTPIAASIAQAYPLTMEQFLNVHSFPKPNPWHQGPSRGRSRVR